MTKLSRLSPEQKTIAKTFTPRPYQNLIINHLLDIKRSNVWAGMGMGKTAATLTALENLYLSGSETKPTLVLAPLRIAQSTWPDEALKWNHLHNIEEQPIIGTAQARMAALKNNTPVYLLLTMTISSGWLTSLETAGLLARLSRTRAPC